MSQSTLKQSHGYGSEVSRVEAKEHSWRCNINIERKPKSSKLALIDVHRSFEGKASRLHDVVRCWDIISNVNLEFGKSAIDEHFSIVCIIDPGEYAANQANFEERTSKLRHKSLEIITIKYWMIFQNITAKGLTKKWYSHEAIKVKVGVSTQRIISGSMIAVTDGGKEMEKLYWHPEVPARYQREFVLEIEIVVCREWGLEPTNHSCFGKANST